MYWWMEEKKRYLMEVDEGKKKERGKREKKKGSLSGICISSSNEIYKNKNYSCASTQKIITKYL